MNLLEKFKEIYEQTGRLDSVQIAAIFAEVENAKLQSDED